ncbi:alanine racemase [Agrococcus sp. SGAir0287]|uniref:alanine racemase n=1 Tax=Agrococcus sp. SGAir0287 TaxID=2070347 RepID=UPI0010CD62EA|nr:alanine racemase [Agrococcus sp. SGAir0287]QCR20829.1 alanine racemase [Agrococcus sp. SGAir0287]
MARAVDASAIVANLQTIVRRTDALVCGVVKADGYGHGAVLAARAMLDGGASWLGVVDVDEAIALRAAGVEAPILTWLHAAEPDLAPAVAARVDVGVSSLAQLEQAAEVGATVHLKVDTGLGRNGVPMGEWPQVVARATALQASGRLRVRGVFSHLAGSGPDADAAQAAAFADACALAAGLEPELRHLANSSATLAAGGVALDMVRVGIAAYGIHPDGDDAQGSAAAAAGLRPAMRVTGSVVDGVLDVGARHGLLPAPGAPVLVGDRVVPVAEVGVAATRLAEAVSGAAVLWGDPARGEPSAIAWAHAAGTIGYEVVTRMAAA